MKNNSSLKKLYIDAYKEIECIDIEKLSNDKEIFKIISKIDNNHLFSSFNQNNFNFNTINNIFRYYEDTLSNLYIIDEELFEIKFKLYIYLIDLFKQLCKTYSKNKNNINRIESIMEILIESKTFLKLRLSLDEEKINILNNHIGQNRYKFSHISYFNIDKKNIDYILESYYVKCEKIVHGYELSKDSDFLSYKKYNENIEKNIFMNNLSFLLLKMIYKINFFHPTLDYNSNNLYLEIVNFFKNFTTFQFNDDFSKELFKESLLKEFIESSKFLESEKINIIDEKIELLQLNTDEYKQLIDIILSIK